MAKTDFMQTDLHQSFMDMKCPKGGDIWKFLTKLRQWRHHLTTIGIPVTDIEYKRTILRSIPEPLASYASQTLNSLTIASRYTCKPVDISELIDMISEEAEHAKSRHAPKDQTQAQGKGKTRQSDKALAATNTSEGGNSKHRKGKCHHCNKEGHWAHECRTRKREEAATENQSGQTAQSTTTTTTKPENKPIGSANAFEDDSDDDGFFMADEDAACMYPYCAELDPLGESEDKSDNNIDKWEAFHTETWGMEDEDDLDWAGLEGLLVKEGKETDVEEEPEEEDIPCSESRPIPHTALHAPQIGDKRPRTTSLCGEQVADTVRHVHHLQDAVRSPEHAHLDNPEPAIRVHKGQTPSFNANMQAHRASWPGPGNVTEEQDVHPASAALLKGEEKWMPTASSKQTAALGTPSTFNTPISPASSSKATPSSSEPAPELDSSPLPAELVTNAQQECAPSPSCTDTAAVKIGFNLDPQPGGDGLAHLGTDDPCLMHIPDCPGAFAEDLGESGGVPTVENSALAPHADPNGTESVFAAETAHAHADTPAPHTLAEAKHSHDRPPWEEPTKDPITCKAHPAAQVLSQMGSVDIDNPNQSDHRGHAVHPLQPVHIDAAFPLYQLANLELSPLSMDHQVHPPIDPAPASAAVCAITQDVPHCEAINTSNWAALSVDPATTFAGANGSMAIYWHAKLGHAFPIDGSTTPLFSR